jgi:hypothetical protein
VNSSEEHRFACEARYVLAMRRQDRNRALAYLQLVRTKRGADAANKLWDAAVALWKTNNGKGQHE